MLTSNNNPRAAALRLSRLLVPVLAILAACSDPGGGAEAQTGSLPDATNRQVPASAGQMQLSFAPLVRRAAPAVVNVLTARQRPRDPFYEMFYGSRPQRPAEVQPTGSGVIVRPDGYIITNNHVVEGATAVRVSLADRREFPARVLLTDPRSDLAVLKIDAAEPLPVLNVDVGEEPQVGDLVLAIGNPFGIGQTVTNGIVSATGRSIPGETGVAAFIQTDASINPGNSGGPLVDMDGDLIGINSAILSRSGTSSGVGFAVPSALVRQVLDTAAGGARRVVRPYLGVGTTAVTSENVRALGLTRPEGLLVGTVTPGSPADRAGLREGDVILEFNNARVNDPAGLNFQIATRRPGDTVPLTVRRNGRSETLRARLDATPELPRERRTLTGEHPLNGATVANLSPDILDPAGLTSLQVEGVLVVDPGSGYAGRGAGFRRMDLIRQVNGRTVHTVQELQGALTGAQSWRITVLRGGREITGEFGA
jgi:Do/DeqQ family serine protease